MKMSLAKVKQTLEKEHKPALKVSFKVREKASETKHSLHLFIFIWQDIHTKRIKITVSSDHCSFHSGNNLQLGANCWYPFYCLGQCLKINTQQHEQRGFLFTFTSTLSTKLVLITKKSTNQIAPLPVQYSLSIGPGTVPGTVPNDPVRSLLKIFW